MRYGLHLAFALPLIATSAAAEGFDLTLYERILEQHTRTVSDTAGVRVDYRGLRESEDWRRLVASLAAADPSKLETSGARLAFWINAYNVLAIDLVLQSYPVDSIRDIGSLLRPVWKRPAGRVAGEPVTLDWIEHRVLRPMGEPRIHAAIVCASVSCPSLLREPWRADRLEAQFDVALKTWLADRDKGLRIDEGAETLWLSPIFDWFEKDFAAAGGVVGFITPYLEKADRSWLEQNPRPRIRHFDYDWRLNDLASASQEPSAGFGR